MAYSSSFVEKTIKENKNKKKKKKQEITSTISQKDKNYTSNFTKQVLSGKYKDPVIYSNAQSTKKDNGKKWYQTILQAPETFKDNLDRFDDGYNFGDITGTIGETLWDTGKTILGTGADIGTSLVKGVSDIGQGVAKLGSGGVAQVADWVGKDEYADKVRNRIAGKDKETNELLNKYTPSGIMKNWNDKVEGSSVIGETGDKVFESVGYIGGIAATGGIAGSGAATATMFGNATGNALGESYQKENAEDWQAWTKAIGSGTIETVSERLFGIFGKSGLDKAVANKVSSKLTSGMAKAFARQGIQATGEALEEFISYAGNQGLDLIIDKANEVTGGTGANFKEDWNWEDLGEQMAVAFLASGTIGSGANVASISDIKSQTGMSTNEAINELGRRQDIEAEIEDVSNETNKLEKKLIKEKDQAKAQKINQQITENKSHIRELESILQPSTNVQDDIAPVNTEQIKNNEVAQQQDIAPIKENAQNAENIVQNNEIAPYQVANVEQTNQPTTQETKTNLATEVDSNAQKTPITESVDGLKAQLENAKGFFEKAKVQEQIKALENGFDTVEEYRVAEEVKKNERIKAKEEEKIQKENEKKQQYLSKQNKLNKEIEEAIPLKREQYKIVQENNPMNDELHVGIRSPKDIKTFDEVIEDEESFVWGDFSKEDAQKALDSGEITIYSSYPIKQGVFVSTSKVQAEEYAGGKDKKVYSKTVPLNEVAWINGDEGQYAKVEETLQNSAEALQNAENTTPTQEELDSLEYTRKNKSGSEYASAFYELEKKYGKANLYKGLNNYKPTGKSLETDVKNQVEEAIAPIKETVEDLKGTIEEFKALTEKDLPIVEKEALNNMKSATDDMAPVREDTTPEYEFENDNEGSKTNVIDPMQDRTLEDVGSRKIKALQQENPEIKPFFQEEAKRMLNDLQNSVKGKRMPIYDETGNMTYAGTTRQTTSDIKALLDSQYGYTYADIEKGLNAIIEDNGKENIAVAKRIEFALNDRLLNGYTDISGTKIPANQDYINLLRGQEYTDYYESLQKSDVVPLENDLESQIENALSNKNSKSRRYLGKVTDYVANKIKDVLGISVNNRRHVLADNDIRHMIKRHGNQDVESLKGQIAITKEDIKKIPDIINNPTDIVKGTDNKAGQTIRYIKRYNDNTTNVVEVVPDNSNALIIKTMWKKPSTLTNSIAPSSTSETQGSDISSTFANNIYQNTENVNNISPVGNKYEAIAPIRDDFDNGGPMLRVSPEMESKTLNKTSENKNVDFDLLEDTSKGNQQQFNTETGKTEDSIEKKTKKEIKEKLLKDTGIMNVSLDEANKLPKILMENTDPIRLQEMIFGRGLGTDINNMFFQKVKDNTSEKIRFQNKERAEIKELGIKARSKESAAVQKYGEKQYVNEKTGEVLPYGDREIASEFPNLETQQKIKNASRVIRQKYDSYLDKTNEVLTKLGYDPIPKRKDYMRHFQELNDIFSRVGIPYNYNEMTANDLPTDINGLTADFSPSKNFFASALQRKGVKTTYDAITGIDGYLEGIGNLIYHTEDIQRLRAYEQYIRDTYGENHGFDNLENLTDEEKAKRIEKIQDNHLSNYASWLHEYTNTLAGKKALIDRSIEGLTGRKIYSFLNTTKTQVGRNMIGFNLSSAMTNVVAEVQALAKTNKLATIKGLADTVKNIFVKDGFVEKNNFLTSRFGSDVLSKNLWQKAGDAGFIFMQGTDNFISQLVVRSKYNEFKSKGYTDEQAHIESGKFASRIMGDRSQGATANIYNSQMLGLVTQFQLEVNNQLYSMFYDTYHESKEVAKGNAAKTAVGMTYTLGQLAVLTHLFGAGFEAMAGYNPTFDILGMLMKAFGLDDDDEEETTGENISQAFGQLVDALPYVNILTGGGRIPVSEAFTGVEDTFKALTGGKDEYGQDVEWADAWKSIKESAPYFLLPTGYSQIKKTTKGLGMYDEDLPIAGSYTDSGNLRFMADDSNWGKIQAGLFGQWATDEAQEYIDSDFKTIRSTDIDEMLELGMVSSEYRDYKTGLSNKRSNEEKIEYISGLNVTDEQKTIMANNVLDRDYDVDMSIYDNFPSYEEFDYYYKYPEKYALGSAITDFKDYLEYKDYIWDLKADKDEEGKSITGTRKAKIIEYVNSLDLDIPQKAMLIREEYSSFNDYNYEIIDYVDGLDKDYEEKTKILEALNMKVEEDGTVSW